MSFEFLTELNEIINPRGRIANFLSSCFVQYFNGYPIRWYFQDNPNAKLLEGWSIYRPDVWYDWRMEGDDHNCPHVRQFDKGVNCHDYDGQDTPVGNFMQLPDVGFENENPISSCDDELSYDGENVLWWN